MVVGVYLGWTGEAAELEILRRVGLGLRSCLSPRLASPDAVTPNDDTLHSTRLAHTSALISSPWSMLP